MNNTEDKIFSWKKEYTEEKTKADVDELRKLFNIPAEDYEQAYKIFDDSFKSKEKERIIIICDFFIEIEKNLQDLNKNLCHLVDQKQYKSSMYLLRGLIENILFNIYISHKLFNHLNKLNFTNFFNLFFKANYGHKRFSFKSLELIKSGKTYSKAISKTLGEKIHINNCLEFYNTTDFKLRFDDIKKMTHFLNERNYPKGFRENFFKFIDASIEGKDTYLQNIYNQLCEVIHPTSVVINSFDDEMSTLNYRTLFNAFLSTQLPYNGIACQTINIGIVEVIRKNKELFTEQFDDFLDKKKVNY
jgi:hypothetical protein